MEMQNLQYSERNDRTICPWGKLTSAFQEEDCFTPLRYVRDDGIIEFFFDLNNSHLNRKSQMIYKLYIIPRHHYAIQNTQSIFPKNQIFQNNLDVINPRSINTLVLLDPFNRFSQAFLQAVLR